MTPCSLTMAEPPEPTRANPTSPSGGRQRRRRSPQGRLSGEPGATPQAAEHAGDGAPQWRLGRTCLLSPSGRVPADDAVLVEDVTSSSEDPTGVEDPAATNVISPVELSLADFEGPVFYDPPHAHLIPDQSLGSSSGGLSPVGAAHRRAEEVPRRSPSDRAPEVSEDGHIRVTWKARKLMPRTRKEADAIQAVQNDLNSLLHVNVRNLCLSLRPDSLLTRLV
jgi:hypothetical protein